MDFDSTTGLVSLDVREPIWERFFAVAPLVLVGTSEPGGGIDLAPKHMATPMGWGNHFGFVCAPTHRTQINAVRTGVFTVSYPRPAQLVTASLAATPRDDANEKPVISALRTVPARKVEGALVEGAYLHLECELERVVENLGDNSLIIGSVVAAHVHQDALRSSDRDDGELLLGAPLVAYLHPGRFAVVDESQAFPFPAGMRR